MDSTDVSIVSILNVAAEIQLGNPRIAYLCRCYALERAHRLNTRRGGRGGREFQASLILSIENTMQDVEETSEEGNSDAHHIQAFYLQYNRNYILGLQNADNVDSILVEKYYQTAVVLFEAMKATSVLESVEVPKEIIEAHAEMYMQHKLLLHPENSNQAQHIKTEVHIDDEKVEKHTHNIYPEQPKPLKIPLQAIKECTHEFNEETNFIGYGGYGRVYKGILTWGEHVNQQVAVKRLNVDWGQGKKEFHTEVTILSHYKHENIITLIGFCDDNNEMILVYEYASHGSLDKYVRGAVMPDGLSWPQLLKICIGVASALDYLHNRVAKKHRIIHRDIKSANILLDENWNAKLADFGLAKIGLANQPNTFVITKPGGTDGYVDPQYRTTGLLTKESDVYSFGVVLFEVLCGRLGWVVNYKDQPGLLNHVAPTCYKNGELGKIVDPRITKDIKPRTLLKFSTIAYQCLQETRKERPTIAEVALQLDEAMKIQLEDTDY